MAKSTSLQVLTADSNGKDLQKTISYANPAAQNHILNNFVRKLNALTTNTFKQVYRVDKEDITDAADE